jgi:hypothetical protein
MFAATTDDVLTIKLALQSARASSDAVDARGVGAAMAPFSLASFYNGCMAVLPVDPFAIHLGQWGYHEMHTLLVAGASGSLTVCNTSTVSEHC